VSREVHAGFCERRRVRLPPPTLLVLVVSGTKAQAETLREEVAAVLAQVGLRLSEHKTRIAHIDEGFDFLGWRIQRQQQRGAVKRVVYTYPSKAALAAVKATVRALTRGMTNHPLKVLLHQLNPVLRGWTSYFRHGVSKVTFSYLRAFVWRRVIGWLRRKHPHNNWKQLRGATYPGGGRPTARWHCSTQRRSRSPATATERHTSPRHGTSGRTGRSRSRPEGLVESRMRRGGARPVRRRGPGKRTARKGGTAPRLDPTASR
jgi:hypothetical protein